MSSRRFVSLAQLRPLDHRDNSGGNGINQHAMFSIFSFSNSFGVADVHRPAAIGRIDAQCQTDIRCIRGFNLRRVSIGSSAKASSTRLGRSLCCGSEPDQAANKSGGPTSIASSTRDPKWEAVAALQAGHLHQARKIDLALRGV